MYLTALELKMLAFIFYRKLTLRPRQKIWYGPYDCILNGNNTNSNGVAVLFKNNFDFRLHTVIRDDEDKYIILDIEMLGKQMTLVNLYAPSSGDHPEFTCYYSLFLCD